MRGRLGLVVVTLALSVLGSESANAGFTINLESVASSMSGFRFGYSARITSGDEIKSGDFFRIYDFYGFVPGSMIAPAGWTTTFEPLTATPPPNVILSHGDDPGVANLIFTYQGAATISGPTTILGFSADSLFPNGTIKNYVGRATQSGGSTAGQPVDSVGTVVVPAIPEPAALVSTGLGVFLIALSAVRSRRRNVR